MRKNNFLVSVIMNCYNGEKYLKQSLKSLINQSYKNWELVFWDNLSQDKSKKILRQFEDKRIKYYRSNKFLNLYSARNAAIRKANGNFICFLDTDDWWLPNKLFLQISEIKKNKNINIIYSNQYSFNQNTKKKKLFSINKLPIGNITQQLLDNYKVGINTVMVRKNIFLNYKFKNDLNIIGDFDFFVKLSLRESFFCIQKPLGYYRIHENNFSKNYDIYLSEMKNWINNNHNFLKKKYSFKKLKYYCFKLTIKKTLNF